MNTPWPIAERPGDDVVRRRQALLEAAARADAAAVRAGLADESDRVRATALLALGRMDQLEPHEAAAATEDPSPRVRRALAQIGATAWALDLQPLLADADHSVCELACWAAGERGAAGAALVPVLAAVCRDHTEPLCREAAVAALGAIGDPAGLDTILAATHDRATVRRRAVLALAPFDSPEVTAALQRALEDRDWQVRQAAEDLLPDT